MNLLEANPEVVIERCMEAAYTINIETFPRLSGDTYVMYSSCASLSEMTPLVMKSETSD